MKTVDNREAMLTDMEWPCAGSVTLQDGGDGVHVEVRGPTATYRPRAAYRDLGSAFLRLRDAEDVRAFVERWGPVRAARLAGATRGGNGVRTGLHSMAPGLIYGVGSFDGSPVYERDNVAEVLEWSAAFRAMPPAMTGADESQRHAAREWLISVLRGMALDFAPEGLAVRLEPRSLIQLVAFAVLESVTGAMSPLVCLAWPAPGCKGRPPERQGDRGRVPLYCSPECAQRARSQRSYSRRRKEALNG